MNLKRKREERLESRRVSILKTKPNQLQSGVFGIKQQSLKHVAFNELGPTLLVIPGLDPGIHTARFSRTMILSCGRGL